MISYLHYLLDDASTWFSTIKLLNDELALPRATLQLPDLIFCGVGLIYKHGRKDLLNIANSETIWIYRFAVVLAGDLGGDGRHQRPMSRGVP